MRPTSWHRHLPGESLKPEEGVAVITVSSGASPVEERPGDWQSSCDRGEEWVQGLTALAYSRVAFLKGGGSKCWLSD